mmetsp:Transcript_15887/g.45665  ORF Transcript_15887/g.45665 Transcript_15887/m.45665 type:complete len:235 (+) Transcript_15887:1013-1717(+)
MPLPHPRPALCRVVVALPLLPRVLPPCSDIGGLRRRTAHGILPVAEPHVLHLHRIAPRDGHRDGVVGDDRRDALQPDDHHVRRILHHPPPLPLRFPIPVPRILFLLQHRKDQLRLVGHVRLPEGGQRAGTEQVLPGILRQHRGSEVQGDQCRDIRRPDVGGGLARDALPAWAVRRWAGDSLRFPVGMHQNHCAREDEKGHLVGPRRERRQRSGWAGGENCHGCFEALPARDTVV